MNSVLVKVEKWFGLFAYMIATALKMYNKAFPNGS